MLQPPSLGVASQSGFILRNPDSNTARLRNRSPQPPLRRGAKSLIKSPNLAGDLGGSILVKNQNLRSIDPDSIRHDLSPINCKSTKMLTTSVKCWRLCVFVIIVNKNKYKFLSKR